MNRQNYQTPVEGMGHGREMEMILATTRRPDITFHMNGRICITSGVARILQLTGDSCVNVARHNGEYLLFAEHEKRKTVRHAARCYPVNAGYRHFRANSVRLCRAILEACGSSGRAALMCGEAVTVNGKTYIPIITKKTL